MESFGQKLRAAIEGLGLDLEDVAQATGFDVQQLEALGRDDFDALPDGEFVAEHLREFARLADVDPDAVIDDYLAERARYQAARPERPSATMGPPGPMAPMAPVPPDIPDLHEVAFHQEVFPGESMPPSPESPQVHRERHATRPLRRSRPLALGLVAVALMVAAALWLGVPEEPDARLMSTRKTAPPVETPAAAPTRSTSTVEPSVSSSLTIPRHGVGTDVVAHELVGEAQRFAEGTQVWFWTEVHGATSGEAIHHVWLRDGHEVVDVPLPLGGARWRTQSVKILSPGSVGDWAVEARDAEGRLVARSLFRCSPGTD